VTFFGSKVEDSVIELQIVRTKNNILFLSPPLSLTLFVAPLKSTSYLMRRRFTSSKFPEWVAK
jgi:hypothetical protein